MSSDMFVPACTNISTAWAQAFLRIMEPGVTEISPLVVTVTDIKDGVPVEVPAVRKTLDAQLQGLGFQTCHTVANTLFPESLWNPTIQDDAKRLFERFESAWPRIRRCRANNLGSYFRRLTAYCPDGCEVPVNQLQHIIDTYRSGNHRRSALQASIFDPTRDHTNSRRLGFPCLHQVAFAPDANGALVVTGFYGTQYLLERAYGNYLGLCRLGRFMAKHMGLPFGKMICIASVAQRGRKTKSQLSPLASQLESVCSSQPKGA